MFTGAPGYNYSLQFLSSGIDEKLPLNQAFLSSFSQESIVFDFNINLRDCLQGEEFTQTGQCIYCTAAMGYALTAMTSPGECTPCPTATSQCLGGSNIGPLPGYWRRTNTSSNFIRCPNPSACLGWVAPEWNQLGQCVAGQHGILCAECDSGYSLTGLAQCGLCPELTSNIVKLTGVVVLVVILFVLMVRSTLAGAAAKKSNTSVFMKILMNHFQLILLVSSFNFQWPEQLETFFAATSPVSQASTQVISIDCFMAAKASFASGSDSYFQTYYLKLLIFALLPVLLGFISYTVWGLQACIKKIKFNPGKAIATLVISLFTVHPNIVQAMFDDFNCDDVDGTSVVYKDMTIRCWSPPYTFWSLFVALPSIVVWGLGIPFFALILMFRERKTLD